MLHRGTWLRKALCFPHRYGWPKTDPETPGVMFSECQRFCGSVRRIQLGELKSPRVVFALPNPSKTRLRPLLRFRKRA